MPPKRGNPEDIDEIRLRSRQAYLGKREELKLAELRKQVEEEAEEERTNPHLSARERREFAQNRKALELATSRRNIDDHLDGYLLPDADYSSKADVLNKRQKDYKSEVQLWEEEQSHKANAAQLQKPGLTLETDYEYVFDPAQAVKWTQDLANIKLPDPERQALQNQLDAAEARAKSIEDVRKSLPVYQYKDEFIAALEQHQIIVIVGETGSGKTTQIPRFCLEWYQRVNKTTEGKVACTQPRRVAAMSVAQRVADEMGVRLGSEVGYAVRFDDRTSEKTRLRFITDGLLCKEVTSNPALSDHFCVIIDEAHERSLSTDILIPILKDLATIRPELKVILMSATLDAQKFSGYFNDAPIFNIPGRTHPVTISYTVSPEANYLSAGITTLFQIHISQGPGDILLFLTGSEEIETAAQQIEETQRKLGSRAAELVICPLYSALDSALQTKVFEPTPPGARKVVLSTNIAETSVTIDGIRFVVDCGLEKQLNYQPKTGLESLVVTPCSRQAAAQRAGRAGRTGPGICLRLYTRHSFLHDMSANTVPEMQRVALTSCVLLLKSLGINDILNFDFLDPPSPDVLIGALTELYALGALTSEGALSSIGRRMAELPLEVKMAKAILAADQFECVDEVLTIVAMLSESSALFLRPKDKKIHADSARSRFTSREGGDLITLLNVFNAWSQAEYDSLWAKENFLQYRSLTRARDVRDQLAKLIDRIEVQSSSSGDEVKIRKAITAGYFSHAARLNRDGQSYRAIANGMTVFVHPSSVFSQQDTSRPLWVLYSELTLTSKEYMKNLMPIDARWLSELAPHFFKKEEIEKLGVEKKMPKGQGKVGVDAR